jgi:hypothetical protein
MNWWPVWVTRGDPVKRGEKREKSKLQPQPTHPPTSHSLHSVVFPPAKCKQDPCGTGPDKEWPVCGHGLEPA